MSVSTLRSQRVSDIGRRFIKVIENKAEFYSESTSRELDSSARNPSVLQAATVSKELRRLNSEKRNKI